MKNPRLRNVSGPSPYFRGVYNAYGLYNWNIKFYGFQNESEIETAQLWCLGDHVQVGKNPLNGNTLRGFENINELLGRKVEASIEGRSGGWLVIDSELTPKELKKVDDFVSSCLKNLPDFLKDERQFHADEELELENQTIKTTAELVNDPRVIEAIDLIKRVSSSDAVLVIKGIKLI